MTCLLHLQYFFVEKGTSQLELTSNGPPSSLLLLPLSPSLNKFEGFSENHENGIFEIHQPTHTSKTKIFEKIVYRFKSFTNVTKKRLLDIQPGLKYTPAYLCPLYAESSCWYITLIWVCFLGVHFCGAAGGDYPLSKTC